MPDYSSEAEHYIDQTLLAELVAGDRVTVLYDVPEMHGDVGYMDVQTSYGGSHSVPIEMPSVPARTWVVTGALYADPNTPQVLNLDGYCVRQRGGQAGSWVRSLRRAPDEPTR